MRIVALTVLAPLFLSGPLYSQETIVPETVPESEVQDAPYKYNALLRVGGFIGSASMVGEGVFATAAHVIFDDGALAWEPIDRTYLFPRHHKRLTYNPSGTSYHPVAFSRWTSYATRVEEDQANGTPAGQSTPDTFNVDFAVGYVSGASALRAHAEVHVDDEREVGIFRDPKLKMIVGYPSNGDYIPVTDQGFMHHTVPGDYYCEWGAISSIEPTWVDSEDLWVAMYDFDGVTTYSGNSGGPMYVQDVEGVWSFGGVVVGSDSTENVLVRAIDEGAWELIETAISDQGSSVPLRVNDLDYLTVTQRSVDLAWTDSSSAEDGYKLFRNEDGTWIELANLEADSEGYLDTDVQPGHIYQYRVQPYTSTGNAPPKSKALTVSTPGSNSVAANFLGQWALKFRNSGQSNWYVNENNRLRAGKSRSQGASTLGLELIGPGTLTFNWSVSSEVNLDYSNPNSPVEGDIYDAMLLHLDGEAVMKGDEPVFLSGFFDAQPQQLTVPDGDHLIEFVYQKDPYTSEGEDTGYLDKLSWAPGPNPYPIYGGFRFSGSDWHGSNWFGNYFAALFPWVGHTELGWLYLRPGDGFSLYLYSVNPKLGDLYTTPYYFPYIYRFASNDWFYLYPGTGNYGSELWIFSLSEQKAIYIP